MLCPPASAFAALARIAILEGCPCHPVAWPGHASFWAVLTPWHVHYVSQGLACQRPRPTLHFDLELICKPHIWSRARSASRVRSIQNWLQQNNAKL